MACAAARVTIRPCGWVAHIDPNVALVACRGLPKKESLFCLTAPLEHIDFHSISYWTSSIWSLWHISLEEDCCLHICWSFQLAARDLLYALRRQDSTYHSLWWTSCGLLVGMENSSNCKCIHHAGSIRHAGGSKPLQQSTLPPECALSQIGALPDMTLDVARI